MKKLKICIALLIAAALFCACSEPDDITVNKLGSSGSDSSLTTESDAVSDTASAETPTSSQQPSSSEQSSSEQAQQIELPADVLAVVNYATSQLFFEESKDGAEFYGDHIEIIGGYECYVIEAFGSEKTLLATYAVAVEYDGVYFLYDSDSEKYRVMTIGNDIIIGDWADSLVSNGVYTNEPSGYTFAYQGEPQIKTDNGTTVFETSLWFLAIEGEAATSTLDFSDEYVRETQEESVLRDMAERLGLKFDWALESDFVNIDGNSFVRRPFFATYNDTVNIDIGTVYYGYAPNGMFYKMVAFSLGESNSVDGLLNGVSFIAPAADGKVLDERTQKDPSLPDSGSSGDSSMADRPFGW